MVEFYTNLRMFGNDVDGSFAEYVAAPARDTIPLPKEIPLENASIIADAISTPYYAVKYRAAVRSGDTVVVVGCRDERRGIGGARPDVVQRRVGAQPAELRGVV